MKTLRRDAIASPPDPTSPQLKQIAAGDEDACRALIDSWETPVAVIASRYAARSADLDDLLQVGRLAVFKAALKYKRSKKTPFANYVKRAIKNRVLREAGRLARQRLGEVPVDAAADQMGQAAGPEYDDGRERVQKWVRELARPYASIFRLLYVENLPQREAAAVLGKSQAWVSLMHRSLLDMARTVFAN